MTSRIRFSDRIAVVRPVLARSARLAAPQPEGPRRRSRTGLLDLLAGGDFITSRTLAPCGCRSGCSSTRASGSPNHLRSRRGAGPAKPGDTLRPADAGVERGPGEGEGGNEDGEFKLVLEFKVDDIVDWLTGKSSSFPI